MAGYPGAHNLQRTTGSVAFDTGIWFTFTTNDSKMQVLSYYDQQLRRIGFRDTVVAHSLEKYNFDANYVLRDCPQYNADIAVDEQSQQVIALLTISLCR